MVDFSFSFAHIMSKSKIVSHHLKKVGIFVSSICHYTKTNSSNKGFVLMAIAITFSYHIRVGIRVTTVIVFT